MHVNEKIIMQTSVIDNKAERRLCNEYKYETEKQISHLTMRLKNK